MEGDCSAVQYVWYGLNDPMHNDDKRRCGWLAVVVLVRRSRKHSRTLSVGVSDSTA